MPDVHALLSASASHRWLNCAPSVHLTKNMPDTAGAAAAEGTVAHALAERLVREAVGLPSVVFEADESAVDDDMRGHCEAYRDFVVDQYNTHTDQILVEERLDYSHVAPEGFGTADCLILSPGNLQVIDFKYGRGVKVEAVHNPQMMLYALGAIRTFGAIYDFDTVQLTIFQPRAGGMSSWETTVEELETWGRDVAAPAAKAAYTGEGDFKSGEWCRFCKANATCRARAEENLALARFEFAKPDLLSADELGQALAQGQRLTAWVRDLEKYALDQTLRTGTCVPGFKVVEGVSRIKWANEADVVGALENTLHAGLITLKPPTITEAKKALGKDEFNALLSPLTVKPAGKPTLVPESDKRAPMEFVDAAADFTN